MCFQLKFIGILQNILAKTALNFYISHFVKIGSISQDGNYCWEFPPPVFPGQPCLPGWEVTAHKSTVIEVKSDISRLKLMGVEVNLHWSPGHSDITGNEMADKRA